MKAVVISSIFLLFAFLHANAQCELIDKVTKQAVEIDSLLKAAKADLVNKEYLKKENLKLNDSLKAMKLDLARLEEFRSKKRELDGSIKIKSDSIESLKLIIIEYDKQMMSINKSNERKLKEEFERGSNEVLASIGASFKNKSFDDLAKNSNLSSIQKDLTLIRIPPELKDLLVDLEKYFLAKRMLELQLDAIQLKIVQSQLAQIKRKSELLGKLNEVIGNYATYTEGLIKLIDNLNALDRKENVAGMAKDIQQQKLSKIMTQISKYIFDYDFNFSDYPYLGSLVIDLIKRKNSNPDADISDLLKRI